MNWRECRDQAEQEQVIRLTREPMGGKIKLTWGLETLRCPPECDQLRVYAVGSEVEITACALAWDWPGRQRYLTGLRIGRAMTGRPRPRLWKSAFESLLANTDHAWTCIGQDNGRARRVLESDAPWLPRYTPREAITTWFVPLPRGQARATDSGALDEQLGITPLDWRHVAVASGSGLDYRLGRCLHRLGLPGIIGPGQRMRLGDYRPAPGVSPRFIRSQLASANGYDGLVVVLPTDSEAASVWRAAAPRLVWKWPTTLYSVSWHRDARLPPVPEWKGSWL